MILFALLINLLPQDYVNLLMSEKYEAAAEYCKKMMGEKPGYKWLLELGDLYYDKLDEPLKAQQVYQEILDKYPQKDGWVYYRLGLVLESQEDYLGAAKTYEIVATRFRKSPLDSFALAGVERCFKKNYQDTAAIVDGYRITRLELDERIAKQSPFAKRDEKAMLDQMILERLLYKEGLKNNVKAMPEYKNMIKQSREKLLLEEVRAVNVIAKADPTDNELRAYYNRNKSNYKVQKEVRGREIVVESESLALFLQDSLRKDINSFDTLAKLYSTAPTKHGGGEMGIIIPGSKPKEVEEQLFKIKLNVISDIIKIEDGKYGLYMVYDRKPERLRTFDEVKNQVEAAVRAEKTQKIEAKFLKDLKSKAKVEIHKENFFHDSMPVNKDSLVVALINGRPVYYIDVEFKNASQPIFAKMDISKPEEFEKVLESYIEEQLQLEVAEQNKYYLYEGFFTKFNDAVRRSLEQGLYTKIVIEGTSVDSAEVRQYYKDHIEDMKVAETIRCKEIVVNSKNEALKIRNELAKYYGERKSIIPFFNKKAHVSDLTMFDSLVKVYSVASTKQRNGDVGILRKGTRPKEFEDVAWKLKVGELSKVFLVGDSNWTIITKTEHTPATYRSFEEMKAGIEMNLLRQKQRETADQYLKKIREQADIKILLPEPALKEPEEKGEEVKPEE